MGYWLGLLQISYWKRDLFFLMGLHLDGDGIKIEFSVQSIMGKPGEPDSLASRSRPCTRSDSRLGLRPLWVSHLKGRGKISSAFFHFHDFPRSLCFWQTLTSTIWSYIDVSTNGMRKCQPSSANCCIITTTAACCAPNTIL